VFGRACGGVLEGVPSRRQKIVWAYELRYKGLEETLVRGMENEKVLRTLYMFIKM
jgi:hypothetical protein